jgi:hypothetical protein
MTGRPTSILVPALEKSKDPEEIKKAIAAYHAYLESVRDKLPVSAYDFAAAEWHYDYSDHRCPHDSWLESFQIHEPSTGDRHQEREIGIVIRLLGAYQDAHLELSYSKVRSYSLSGKTPVRPGGGHGDWLSDEIRLSEQGTVLHEIVFGSGSRWLIECADVEVRWVPHS